MLANARLMVALCAMLLVASVAARQPLDENTPPGTLLNVIAEGTSDPFEIQRLSAPLFGRHGSPVIENSVASYRLTFATTGLDGNPEAVEAQLFVPQLPAPEALPLYVFGSGTTGIADACAPSRELAYGRALGHARPYLLAYAGRGFTAVIPDYLGYGDPERVQSYFNAEAESRVMLDAVRAVREFYEREAGSPAAPAGVFLSGYSQGGHAAFAAADVLPVYAPEVELTGIIGYGATTDVESLLREGPFYAPYIAMSYSQDYGSDLFDPQEILAPRWLPGLAREAGTLCVDRAQQFYPFDGNLIYASDFAAALYGRTLERDYPEIARVLRLNSTGLSGHGLPSLIVQGEDDVVVWNDTQTRFATELCERGSDVLYLLYPGVRHRETRPVAFEESIAWMRSLIRGEPTATSCELLD